FKDVWGALVKAGWTSERPSSKCLDTRYKYIRPGGRHDGAEGVDYLLGELAILRYTEDLRVSEVPAEDAAPGTSQEVVAGCGAGERGARGRGAGGRHGGCTAGQGAGVDAETSGVGDSVGVSEDVQIHKVLNLTAVGCGTALAWTPVARLVRQALLQGVREGVAHEGAVQERVVQEGVARQEDVEDVRPNKALNRTAGGWATASAWAPVGT
ncbi:hypothetical protein PF007_g31251, partial [Phytophthora fragariae]